MSILTFEAINNEGLRKAS